MSIGYPLNNYIIHHHGETDTENFRSFRLLFGFQVFRTLLHLLTYNIS